MDTNWMDFMAIKMGTKRCRRRSGWAVIVLMVFMVEIVVVVLVISAVVFVPKIKMLRL